MWLLARRPTTTVDELRDVGGKPAFSRIAFGMAGIGLAGIELASIEYATCALATAVWDLQRRFVRPAESRGLERRSGVRTQLRVATCGPVPKIVINGDRNTTISLAVSRETESRRRVQSG